MRAPIRVLALLFALVFAVSTTAVAAAPSARADTTGGCYGASCNDRNPQGLCGGDAKTVGAMDVGDGMLELRWSPSCAANWGRFTAYSRTEATYLSSHVIIHARVTVWNPGAQSYQTAHHALNIGESTWSNMTDGRPQACTGVEITHVYQADSGSGAVDDYQSQGWTWGPCY